ncbi:MAG: 2OG-Fe dioxygenase family protein [Rubrivivax sp.]
MELQTHTPPITAPAEVDAQLRAQGHAVLDLQTLPRPMADALGRWQAFWARLPSDQHLRDGGRYRRRRHGCFIADGESLQPVPHRAHWQPVQYNALHGGIERWFEPLEPALASDPAWRELLLSLGHHASALRGQRPWYVEAHCFRIDTTDGIGRPTPEGAHRDGVDLVAVMLLSRHGVKGGETRVFDVRSPQGQRFTMTAPGTTLLLDDARVIHETTPIQPLQDGSGHRDTLVLTYRAGGFQSA